MILSGFLILLAAIAGVIIQTIAGLGFLLLLTPVLLLYFDSVTALSIALIVGCFLSLLILFKEKRKAKVNYRLIGGLFTASLPGILLGVLILNMVSKELLQIVVGVTIIAVALLQQYSFSKPVSQAYLGKAALVSGFFAGLLNAATSMGGPALALWLRSRIITHNQIRDILAVMFILLNLTSLLLIQTSNSFIFDKKGIVILILLFPFILAGHLTGRLARRKVYNEHYRNIVLAVIISAGVMSATIGIVNL